MQNYLHIDLLIFITGSTLLYWKKKVISMIIWSLYIYKKGRWTAEASFWILSSTDRLTFSVAYEDFLMWYDCWEQLSSNKFYLKNIKWIKNLQLRDKKKEIAKCQ